MKFATFLILSLFSIQICAQDAHYATEQFGNRSMLLGGNVVGSVDDLGAVFYNPARVALQENATFLLSAEAYQYVTLKVKDGVDKTDLDDSKFGSAPTLAAGNFSLKKFPKHKFAYAFLSKTNFEYSLSVQDERSYGFQPTWDDPNKGGVQDETDDEDLYTNLNIKKDLKDEWVGFTWAYSFTDHFSLGVSNFLSTWDQRVTYLMEMDAVSYENRVGSFVRVRKRNSTIMSWVPKIGVTWDYEKVNIGLTVTPPRVKIMSSGSATYEETLAGFDRNRNGDYEEPEDNIFINNRQSDVAVANKAPWSIAAGVGVSIGKNKLHVSAEWFSAVDRYVAMEPEPFIAQNPVQEIKNRVFDERKSVLNFGLGGEWVLNDNISGYASFATDFSYLIRSQKGSAGEITDGFDNSSFTADIFHYGGGFVFNFEKLELTLGGIYSRSELEIGKLVNFPGDGNPNDPEEVPVIWERWRVLIGFTLPFYKFG